MSWYSQRDALSLNRKQLDEFKKCPSAADNFTYQFGWFKDPEQQPLAGGYWMHKFTSDDPAFCTLREFLNTDKFSQLWNNRALTKKVVFYRDSLGGDILTEEEACVLNEKYRPVQEEEEVAQP